MPDVVAFSQSVTELFPVESQESIENHKKIVTYKNKTNFMPVYLKYFTRNNLKLKIDKLIGYTFRMNASRNKIV